MVYRNKFLTNNVLAVTRNIINIVFILDLLSLGPFGRAEGVILH